jgi:hypothetical protein
MNGCEARALLFDGSPEMIESMIRSGIAVKGDLYLDWDVKGNQMSRRALDAIFERLGSDPSITHVFICRADRLARPDDIKEGLALEERFRREFRVTLVYEGREAKPLKPGEKIDVGEWIRAGLEFDRAEQDRRDLARKMLNSQPSRARNGYMTGDPPYASEDARNAGPRPLQRS